MSCFCIGIIRPQLISNRFMLYLTIALISLMLLSASIVGASDPSTLIKVPENWYEPSQPKQFSLMGNQYVAKMYIPGDLNDWVPTVGRLNGEGQIEAINDRNEMLAVLAYAQTMYATYHSMMAPKGSSYWRTQSNQWKNAAEDSDPANADGAIFLLKTGDILFQIGLSMAFAPASSSGAVTSLKALATLDKMALIVKIGSYLTDLFQNLYFYRPHNTEILYALMAQHLLSPKELAEIGMIDSELCTKLHQYLQRGVEVAQLGWEIDSNGISALGFLIDTA